ncbi:MULTISPECIES: competence protein CoiA [Neobacillus]|uniref:Competence protein CoiA n=1 Tax=Neobacillus rhizophilus TaxID=2833579 RepID=A0A942U2P5_9BACI|nr:MULTISPECIES: competence protein CoiA family protein [Neobacillus]MBS4212135.1 hypothetical protein [Neobacillus rhizophilus]MBU8915565.1 hypothetical protein [Bacillus sp. FJAT-29953]
MLTAQTKTGKQISLGNCYSKEALLSLRKSEEFICPVCGENVSLKLGEQRIFHFAHKKGSTCCEVYEAESINHIEGKLQLYHWLCMQKIPCILEFYDRKMQQRPDIMFEHNGQRFALEFQCSTLSEEIFWKRTKNYLEHHYTPLWIISSHHIHQKNRYIIPFSNFHYLFLRTGMAGQLYIPCYSTEKKAFQLISSITPYSIKNAFAEQSFNSLDRLRLEDLLNPKPDAWKINLLKWKEAAENYQISWVLHAGAVKNPFLHEIYQRKLNLFLLPPEIGLPVPHAVYIQTPPVVWQTYLFLDCLADKNPGALISYQDIHYQVQKRISKKDITIRTFPLLETINPMIPVIEYFRTLIELGVLIRKGDWLCEINRKIKIPQSNREKDEAKSKFYQNNK